MSDTSLPKHDDEPASARDAAAPIKLALALSAIVAVGLVAWNIFAALH